MKFSSRYIGFTVILVVMMLIQFNNWRFGNAQVDTFRGAEIKEDIWYPLIADDVNSKILSLVVDNRVYSNQNTDIYMNDRLEIMVPTDIVNECFNCSAGVYEGERLTVEKHDASVTFRTHDKTLTERGDKFYVSANNLSKSLKYDYNWDVTKNTATATDISGASSIYPSYYDRREKGLATTVKNQGNLGTCWASAAVSALESSLLPEERLEFSVDHMTLSNSFRQAQSNGGEYTMGMAYLLAWQGPVYEADDPYGDGETNKKLKPVKHVQEIQVIEGKDFEKIKEAVFKYGGVQTAIYTAMDNALEQSPYYNSGNDTYCYIGTAKPNHEVLIIGWDDNFPKERFNTELEGDGAFICQNSWGGSFGDNGVFYVSYYDTNIGVHNVVYTKIEETDNYDTIYQSDLCGWVGQIGYNKEYVYGANLYTAKKNEQLKAAGFYATGKNTKYQVYVAKDISEKNDLKKRELVAEGSVENAGFYTIDFNKAIDVKKGEKFAIIIYINTPESVHPLAIEYAADSMTASVTLEDGEGYISADGIEWESAEENQNCNLCIKAYAGR